MNQKKTIKRTVDVDIVTDKDGNVLGEFPSPMDLNTFLSLGGTLYRHERQTREMSLEDFIRCSRNVKEEAE